MLLRPLYRPGQVGILHRHARYISSSSASKLFPKFMRKYADKVKQAPTTHVAAFLFLHEISAIVPLVAIWGSMYYFDYLPFVPENVLDQGSALIQRICDRYSWLTDASPKFVAQGCVAYGLVKLAVPLRLLFSFAAAPWLANKTTTLVKYIGGRM